MLQTVTRDEAQYFQTSNDLLERRENYEGDRAGKYVIVTASFEGKYKWRLFDGHARFTADIVDKEFLNRVNAGERFGKGDMLVANLHIRQWRDDTGLHAEYKITHVSEVVPATRQITLV